MATKYWKGNGSGIWDTQVSATANWSTTSSGNINAIPPTTSDTAFLMEIQEAALLVVVYAAYLVLQMHMEV